MHQPENGQHDRIGSRYIISPAVLHREGWLARHPIPVILLARLAVDKSEAGKGLGKALLKDALVRIASAADIVGARAVLVHAIDEQARKFYEHFDFESSPIHELQLMLLMKDLRKALEE